METGTRERASWAAHNGWRLAGFALAAALLAILGLVLYERWQELPREVLAPDWGRAGVAVALFLASAASCALQWRRTLWLLGHRLSVVEAVYIHFLAQAGKYLPGKVMLVVGKLMLATRQGLPIQGVTASVVYEQALYLMSGALSALVFTSLASADVIGRHRPIVLMVCVAGFALLHPAVMGQVFRGVRWASRAELTVPAISYRDTLKLLAGFCIPWFITGCAFYLFVTSFVPLGLRWFPDMAAAVVLSGILGLVSLFAPAGLGVREAALTVLLSAYFPLPVSVAIALAFRVATTLVDGLGIVGALALQGRASMKSRARMKRPSPGTREKRSSQDSAGR
jgi:uncharacterized membrane protein YbhN (UPF0104 family)